jgi:hypothetical protein
MKSRVKWLYAVLAVAVAVWAYDQWNSDRRRIGRQLSRLQSLVEKDGDENALSQASRAAEVGELLTAAFEIQLGPFSTAVTDRARLSQVMYQYRSRASRIGVDFRDQELTIDDRLRIGDMTVVAAIDGTADGGFYREAYRFRIRWVVEDGEWRMQRAELLEILEGSPGLF